jgi:hypothetical protein
MGLREIETVNWIRVPRDGIYRHAFVNMVMNSRFSFKFDNLLHTSTYPHFEDDSEPFICISLIVNLWER